MLQEFDDSSHASLHTRPWAAQYASHVPYVLSMLSMTAEHVPQVTPFLMSVQVLVSHPVAGGGGAGVGPAVPT